MRILMSWNASNNDFLLDDRKNPIGVDLNGVHFEFYQHFSDYDKHILLNTENDQDKHVPFEHLIKALNELDTIPVIGKYMDINDPSDVGKVKEKVTPLLLDYKNHDIEIFISPGTPAMQTVWYLLGQENTISLRLFKIAPPKYRESKIPVRQYINFNFSNVPTTAYIREHHHRKKHTANDADTFINPSNEACFDLATKVASMDGITALILGETGTGKEVIARHIHKNSVRKNNQFVSINCAALNDELLESRLFGHEKGAFTGAVNKYKGVFSQANKGTIFLDEIGDISKKLQVSLLRVLQDRKITRLGGNTSEKVDVRVIAATNNELWKKVQDGSFRSDLFFRLAVAEISLPAVRDYTESDKLDLIHKVHKKVAQRLSKPPLKIDDSVINALLRYTFPGNIRELEHWFERWFTYCNGNVSIQDFKPRTYNNPEADVTNIYEAEKLHIKKVLKRYEGKSKKAVCMALGVHFQTFQNKLEKYDLRF